MLLTFRPFMSAANGQSELSERCAFSAVAGLVVAAGRSDSSGFQVKTSLPKSGGFAVVGTHCHCWPPKALRGPEHELRFPYTGQYLEAASRPGTGFPSCRPGREDHPRSRARRNTENTSTRGTPVKPGFVIKID